MAITLIGYRGTGKSTVGARLAARLGWRFVDVDPEIERRAGQTIRDVFDRQGEPEFRRIEAQVIAELATTEDLVLAPGGGAVLNDQTRERLRRAGPVVWLQADVDVLIARLNADPGTADHRPPLTSLPAPQEISEVLARRAPIYRETATISVSTDLADVDSLVEEIIHRLGLIARGSPPPEAGR